MEKTYKILFSILIVLFSLSLFGCTGTDITSIAKSNPEIANFLNDYPSAKLLATYYSADQVSQMSAEINQACETTIINGDYYRIKVDNLDNNTSLIAWIRVSDSKVICVIKNSGTKSVVQTDTNNLIGTDTNITPGGSVGTQIIGPDFNQEEDQTIIADETDSMEDVNNDSSEPILVKVTDSLGNVQTNSWSKGTGGDWKPELRSSPNDLYCSNCNVNIGDKITFTINANQENLEYKCYHEPPGGSFIAFTDWASTNSCEWTVSPEDYGQSALVIVSIRNKNGFEYMGVGNGDDYTYLSYHANSNNQTQLKLNGVSCSLASECQGNYCVHNKCRSSQTFCTDRYCDNGETCSSCSQDCGTCSSICGNGICETGELHSACPSDCTCTPNWECSAWTSCNQSGEQTRTCQDLSSCGTDSGKPAQSQTCTYTPLTCIENWNCSSWSTCSNSVQMRICTDASQCGTTINKPSETQACTSSNKWSEIMINSNLEQMLPLLSDMPTQYESAGGISGIIISETGFDSGKKNSFDKIGQIYGSTAELFAVDFEVYKFSSVDDAKAYYNKQVNSIKQSGGYTELTVSSNSECFAYKEDYGFTASFASSYCGKGNIVFNTLITLANSYQPPGSLLNQMLPKLENKIK